MAPVLQPSRNYVHRFDAAGGYTMKCQRCQTEDAQFRVFTDVIDIDVCLLCAEVARQLKIDTEGLSRTGKPSNLVQLR